MVYKLAKGITVESLSVLLVLVVLKVKKIQFGQNSRHFLVDIQF